MKSCVTSTNASNSFLSFSSRTWNSGSCDHYISREETSRFLRHYAVWEINAFLWISLVTITFLLGRKLFKLFKLWAQGCRIPGPPCPSFSGHFNTISKKSLTDLLSDSHDEYGSVVKLWLGPTQLLVSIKDPELIKEMLVKAKDKLPLTGKAFRLAFGRSTLFASSFDKKVEGRRELLASELNGRLLKRANMIPTDAMDCIMEKLHQTIGKGSVDCKMVSQHIAFTFVGATLFGDTFFASSKSTIYEELLTKIAKDACFWASYIVTPFWERGFWRYQQLCTKLKCLTHDLVQQCSKSYKLYCHKDQIPGNETANAAVEATVGSESCSGIFLQDICSLEELNGCFNAREETCSNIMGMMLHGCLTTGGLINNMLVRLVMHPDIQHKIYTEIRMAQKSSEKQDRHDAEKMPLLFATIYESARLMPAGPLLQRCSLKHDLRLKSGVIIPAGAILVVPVQLVQMEDSSWGNDAAKFNPYRFLSKTEKISGSLNKYISIAGPLEELIEQGQGSFVLNDPNENPAFLSFGSGTRACICQKFVTQGIVTLFAILLEQYEVRPQTNSKPMTNDTIFQNFPSLQIAFVRRNN